MKINRSIFDKIVRGGRTIKAPNDDGSECAHKNVRNPTWFPNSSLYICLRRCKAANKETIREAASHSEDGDDADNFPNIHNKLLCDRTSTVRRDYVTNVKSRDNARNRLRLSRDSFSRSAFA